MIDPNVLNILVIALIAVESGGDCNVVGDDGLAVGCLQIRPIMVQDVNRILECPAFSLKDRYDKKASVEILRVYSNHYCTKKRLGHKPTMRDISRNWNGGPNGYKKKSTIKYWKKVETELSKKG